MCKNKLFSNLLHLSLALFFIFLITACAGGETITEEVTRVVIETTEESAATEEETAEVEVEDSCTQELKEREHVEGPESNNVEERFCTEIIIVAEAEQDFLSLLTELGIEHPPDSNKIYTISKTESEPGIEIWLIDNLNRNKSSLEWANEFNRLARERGIDAKAEPNYIIAGYPGSDPSIEGAPDDDTIIVTEKLPGKDIWHNQAIGLIPLQHTGKGVNVVIFDSIPFEKGTGEYPIENNLWSSPFTISVVKNDQIVLDASPTLPMSKKDPDIPLGLNNHGLFIAGLVNNVAPDANIELRQVYDYTLKDNLDTLIKQLYDYKLDQNENLRKTIVNLSLGVINPDKNAVDSLYKVLKDYDELGAVIVAAAGNIDTNKDDNQPIDYTTQIPANYSFVISVASSNGDDQPSCFTKNGNLAAPGGDLIECNVNELEKVQCNDQSPCLVSTVHKEYSDAGFAYWRGTSFATPLVTGLIALIIDADEAFPNNVISPKRIRQMLLKNCNYDDRDDKEVRLGSGVINIKHIFDCFEIKDNHLPNPNAKQNDGFWNINDDANIAESEDCQTPCFNVNSGSFEGSIDIPSSEEKYALAIGCAYGDASLEVTATLNNGDVIFTPPSWTTTANPSDEWQAILRVYQPFSGGNVKIALKQLNSDDNLTARFDSVGIFVFASEADAQEHYNNYRSWCELSP
jgi:subtilisin family serine protease